MGQKPVDGGNNEPSLKLPSLALPGFGRKKKSKGDVPPDDASDRASSAPEPAADQAPSTAVAEPAAEPTASLSVEDVSEASRHADSDSHGAGFSLPAIPGRVAAIITGVVVGVVGTALTYASLRGCEAVKGTQSCGGTGFFVLVAILALMLLLGGVLLKGWQVADPHSTSFLAVGILCVVLLVTLMEVLFSPWMFLLVPLISAAAYALSHWVTSRFIEPAEPGQDHDVR